MTLKEKDKKDYDEILEPQFVLDYAEFAAQINFHLVAAIREKVIRSQDVIERKCLVLSGIQVLYSSLEDFSILLHAFIKKGEGIYLHLTLGVDETNNEGTTFIPRRFKRFVSTQNFLDTLGFSKVTPLLLQKKVNYTEEQLEKLFREVVESVKKIGEYQRDANISKNMLKHGKALINEKNDSVAFLRWEKRGGREMLNWGHLSVSLEELDGAVRNVANMYKQSIELLWLFFLNYYPGEEPSFRSKIIERIIPKYDEYLRVTLAR